ncbi:MAG: caspase domain-containing protein [bacterium]
MAKKALLVGINDYKGIGDLSGCVNDVTNMRNVLRNYFGFENTDIRVLVDSRASKENILSRLDWLVAGAHPGDYLVFHFAGHGSQIRDRGPKDELKDNLDELICPWDMDWDGTFITDDDLNDKFKQLADGAFLEVFLDCCHSGSGTRDIGLGRPPELGPEKPVVSRFLPPPIDILCRYEGEEERLQPTRGFRAEDRSTLNHILWAGCQDNQTSADAHINGTYNGAFTYYFCKHLREAGGRINREILLRRVRDSLRFNGYSQIPQLETDETRRHGDVLTAETPVAEVSA